MRPLFLSLFETHILELDGAALRPALKAVILSLLPGLEDETSEDFERMVSALDKLRDAVKSHNDEITDSKSDSGSFHFWQCFFLASITNASRRQGALAYLVRRLPKFSLSKTSADSSSLSPDAEAAISPEPGLLIRCFEAGLSDPQLLIQRGFLDLLVTHLPLDSVVLQSRIGKQDLARLVAAAAGVVSRKDMSLNRRLWAWFLGPEQPAASEGHESTVSPTQDRHGSVAEPSAHQAAYFSQYGLRALTHSVMQAINRPSAVPAERARPFRLCLSLMDRWEVGGLIVPKVFLPALQSVQSYSEVAPKDHVDEVMRSASSFFDGVDSGLIWGQLIQLVTTSLDFDNTNRQEALRQMKLARFVLARFNLKEEEMLHYHMPLMILSTLTALNQAINKPAGKSPLDREVVDMAFEIADSLVQVVPERAIKGDPPSARDLKATTQADGTAIQKVRSFYEESQGSLDMADPPFATSVLGQLIMRESSHMFTTSIAPQSLVSAEMPSRILSNIIFKVQWFAALDDLDMFSVLQGTLTAQSHLSDQQLSFPGLSALTTVLTALQTARRFDPYIGTSQISELIHPLVAALWQYLSPVMPKYHVEAVRCMLQLHTISPSSRTVEAAIASIVMQQSPFLPSSSVGSDDAGRRFAILWTHTMYELSLQSEKRGSLSRRSSGIGPPPPAPQALSFSDILMRPLFLLLDSLSDEGTQTAAFIRTWLQDLPTLNKIFDVLAACLQSLNCLSSSDSLVPGKIQHPQKRRAQTDDAKDCLYYLTIIHEILKRPSHYTWATLAEESAPRNDEPSAKIPLQEWLIKTCLKTLSLDIAEAEANEKSYLHELHRTSVAIISQIYRSPFASSLRDLELEVPLLARMRTASASLQSLLLDAILMTLRLRLTRPAEDQSVDHKVQNQAAQRSRLSLAISRDSEDVERAPIPPPAQLIETLKYGFSSLSSRLVLDDWVHFLVEVLPLFPDAISQNLLPLVECFCKEIKKTFEQLQAIFTAQKVDSSISPESTLISLINGLEQILARAHDRLMQQETKSAVNKSPEQPQGFFGNMVSGVFSSETNPTRTPTANSRLTVLLCFQDTVRICFAIWSWGGYGPNHGKQDPTSASSFGYTSLRMRNRARRILEHLFAAEALECLETLAVVWAQSPKDDVQVTAIMGLLNVLNGSKPKHTIPAMFNAVYSRTNPNALDPYRMSTLTSDLTDTDLVSFLVDYTKSLEDDAMDEIWQDCTLFLRDVLANPLPHRQILPSLLEFTAVIGRKVDNTNFGEQRKMRKELAVSAFCLI